MLGAVNSTLTIRLPKDQRTALQRRAAALHKTESDLVRELIANESGRAFDFENVRSFAGIFCSLDQPRPAPSWREQIRARNWRK